LLSFADIDIAVCNIFIIFLLSLHIWYNINFNPAWNVFLWQWYYILETMLAYKIGHIHYSGINRVKRQNRSDIDRSDSVTKSLCRFKNVVTNFLLNVLLFLLCFTLTSVLLVNVLALKGNEHFY